MNVKAVHEALLDVARQETVITYGQIIPIAEMSGMGEGVGGALGRLFGTIVRAEIARDANAPMLSAVAVSTEKNRPSKGFFDLARELGRLTSTDEKVETAFWTAELKRVYAYFGQNPTAPVDLPSDTIIEIPTQNEFLLPFLQRLSFYQKCTRAQLTQELLAHFGLPEHVMQYKMGHVGIIANRVGWCDAYFAKAGFITKKPHATDSQADELSITPLGLRELKYYADAITVGYLQSFYRGKIIRGAKADDSTSEAERTLYEAFSQLGDDWTVIQGASWFAKDMGTVGEIDFLIAHRKDGVLVMEVKGGHISVQNGNWTTTNRHGITAKLKSDPCEQADRNRRELRTWLEASPITKGWHYAIFPAVAFPDSQVSGNMRPDCPEEIVLDIRHLDNVEARLLAIFAYWKTRADKSNKRWDGQKAIDGLVGLFQITKSLQPQITETFKRENKIINDLTISQFKVLRQLRYIKRTAIVGGAGTGKTLLAMEKAQQLLTEGFRVLVLCYNRNLQIWLQFKMTHAALMVFTFHGAVGQARAWAGVEDAEMSMSEFDANAPEFLLIACDIVRQTHPDLLFDALIVDEGQDFQEVWWIALPELLKNPHEDILYIFFDDNQRLYAKTSDIPMSQTPLVLTENCRNTQYIHNKMIEYAHEGDITECMGPEGRPIDIRNAGDAQKDLQRVLHELINEQGVSTDDIIILTPSSRERSQWKEKLRLGNFALTWVLDNAVPMWVRVSTIYSYKGLESAVVILTELENCRDEVRDMLMYVGLSRARHHVVVIGELPPPQGKG